MGSKTVDRGSWFAGGGRAILQYFREQFYIVQMKLQELPAARILSLH
jgi:hypothetical protein